MQHSSQEVFWAFATVVWLCASTITRSDSITLVPSEDATISERNPDSVLGLNGTLDCGTDGPEGGGLRNRALLKFDLASSIPSNAIITSAALTLTLVTAPSTTNVWFSLRKVMQNWSENAAAWTNRLSPSAPWSVPGGAAPADYSSSVTQSNLIVGGIVPAAFTFISNPAMVADTRDWVSDPTNNFGWILICELEELEKSKRKFASREYGSTNTAGFTNRPSLEVQFMLPPTLLSLMPLASTNGQFQFLFNAESNRNYTAEYSSDLSGTNWLVLTNITPLPAPENVLVSTTLLTKSNRFYRVRTP